MKRFVLIIMAMTMFSFCWATPSKRYVMVVSLTDGGQAIYQLSERPQLLWEGNDVIITAGATNVSVAKEQFGGFTIEENVDAIKTANGSNRTVYQADGYVIVEGVNQTDNVNVYDSTGKIVSRGVRNSDNSVKVNIKRLPHGVYVVKSESMPSIKIIRP